MFKTLFISSLVCVILFFIITIALDVIANSINSVVSAKEKKNIKKIYRICSLLFIISMIIMLGMTIINETEVDRYYNTEYDLKAILEEFDKNNIEYSIDTINNHDVEYLSIRYNKFKQTYRYIYYSHQANHISNGDNYNGINFNKYKIKKD